MLSRRRAVIMGSVVGVLIGLAATGAARADDPPVNCPPVGPCNVGANKPGGGGGGGGNPGGSGDPGLWGCKTSVADPQPPVPDPVWKGHTPKDGAIYITMCKQGINGPAGIGWNITQFFSATPPARAIDPALVAQDAIKLLPITGPDIHTAPRAGGSGLVGLPVWVWTPPTASTWGPVSRTASVTGVSVTATAQATQIVYSMGDGTSITCWRPGTPYQASFGREPSPDCGYAAGYQRPSRTVAGGRYTITGVTTWHVTWAGGGETGELSVTRTAASTIRIGELQVISQ
jgi:hypothetical protein